VPRLLVTGAYGYLGSRLRKAVEVAGWESTALVRHPRTGDAALAWTLGETVPSSAFAGIDALLHCAYDLTVRTEDAIRRVNIDGSRALLQSAERAGVKKILVISSMSAYEGTRQLYGRAKLAIESLTLELGGIAVRPGLVYGIDPGGMAGNLVRLASLPVVPVLDGNAKQYTVHEDDLAAVLIRVLNAPSWTPEVFGVAHPRAVSFRELISGQSRGNRNHRVVPIPWRVLYAILNVSELLRFPIRLRADSLLGLVYPAPYVASSSAYPDIPDCLRPFPVSGFAAEAKASE